jgi:hypothetical protein
MAMKNSCPWCQGTDIVFGVSPRNLTRHIDDDVYHTECLVTMLGGKMVTTMPRDFPEYDRPEVPTENLASHNVETLITLLGNANDEVRHALIRREEIRITLLKKMQEHNMQFERFDQEFRKSMSPEVEEGIARGERY